MDKHGSKSDERSLSMTEILTALTHAQKEREASLDEFKRMSEAEKRRAEVAHSQLQVLESELGQAKENAEDLNRKQKDLEVLIENERVSHNSALKKKEDEYNEKCNDMKGKISILQKKLRKSEEMNSEMSDELTHAKNKIKSSIEEEEKLKTDIKNLKVELTNIKEDLNQSIKKSEIADSELHIAKMQLLKENNINNRLIDELKRVRKDIEGYREEIERLKNLRDSHKTDLSKQIKELATLVTNNGKEVSEDNLREIRATLSTILKENFLLNNRINDVYTVLTRGETPLISVTTQTNIGLPEMFSYENMDKEATCLVMRLREELVTTKSDLLEIKQQNDGLKGLLKNLKEEKEHRDATEEEENRVERLEEAVLYLKQMLKEDEKTSTTTHNNDISLIETLEGMRKDLDKLKDHVIQTNSKQENETTDFHFRPFTKPVKLLPTRRFNQ